MPAVIVHEETNVKLHEYSWGGKWWLGELMRLDARFMRLSLLPLQSHLATSPNHPVLHQCVPAKSISTLAHAACIPFASGTGIEIAFLTSSFHLELDSSSFPTLKIPDIYSIVYAPFTTRDGIRPRVRELDAHFTPTRVARFSLLREIEGICVIGGVFTTMLRRTHIDVHVGSVHAFRVTIPAFCFIGFFPPIYTLLLGTLTHPHWWCSPKWRIYAT
ncbi:hypothetical protein BJ165DRAFT_1409819 [Panaeolus papilionaceus]|nr:hypothetical protein BJ165DRAFT_1409819 [Panaeolus papilionaceus]